MYPIAIQLNFCPKCDFPECASTFITTVWLCSYPSLNVSFNKTPCVHLSPPLPLAIFRYGKFQTHTELFSEHPFTHHRGCAFRYIYVITSPFSHPSVHPPHRFILVFGAFLKLQTSVHSLLQIFQHACH